MKRTIVKSVFLAMLFLVVGAQPALAYIDPASGGMLFQILAVVFASLSAMVLIFSRQIRMLFARVKRAVRGLSGDQSEPVEDGETTAELAEQPETPAASPEPGAEEEE
jgi:hypothetical protein